MLPLCLRHFTFYIPARACFPLSALQRANRVSSPPDDELLLWGRAANVKKGKRNGKKWQIAVLRRALTSLPSFLLPFCGHLALIN